MGHNDVEIIHRYLDDIYFETAAMILTLVTIGKYLETKSKAKTKDTVKKLMNLKPKTAVVIRNNVESEILIEEIKIEDIVIIKPGMSIPVDGIVVNRQIFCG